jgi:15-cis-phytoene synthase
MISLEASNEYCRKVTRGRARNFYYAFVLLGREQRQAMYAVYAFMRQCDDLSDEPGATRAALDLWRDQMEAALEGRFSEHPVWPAFHDAAECFAIPREYFREMIAGVASDLEPRRLRTFEELYRYCYQVASVAGLAALHIFGFQRAEALEIAEKCGVAFQLTNILRDVREDIERDRIYLPEEDMARFGVTAEALKEGRCDEPFRQLMAFEAARAEAYYGEARLLPAMVNAHSRPSLTALIAIYSRLLERIELSGYDVFSQRVRLSAAEKVRIALTALAG